MKVFDLQQDLAFLLHGCSETEQKEILKAFAPLTFETKTTFNENEFIAVVDERLGSDHVAMQRGLSLFHDVKKVYIMDSDLFYNFDGASHDPALASAGVFVDFDDENFAHYEDLYDRMSTWYQYESENEEEIPKLTKDLIATYDLNLATQFKASEIEEARKLFFSQELAWLPPKERVEIIKNSFDPTVIAQKDEKFKSYIGTAKSEDHRKIAEDYLTGSHVSMKKYLGPKVSLTRALDWVSLTILVESAGDETEDYKDSYMGLMQVGMKNFPDYAPDGFNGENYEDVSINIGTGTKYLIENCFGVGRNTYQTYSRAIANYNMGSGEVNNYRMGRRSLPVETKDYVRDYLIYARFMGWEIV